MVNPVSELRRAFRDCRAGDHQTSESPDDHYGEPCQWVRSRIHVALLMISPNPYRPFLCEGKDRSHPKHRTDLTIHHITVPLRCVQFKENIEPGASASGYRRD